MPQRSAEYWMRRAEEARTMAQEMHETQAKDATLLIVAQYEFLAEYTRKLEDEARGKHVAEPK